MPSGLGISASQNPACTLITWETAKIPDSRASWAADAIGPSTAFWGARLYSLPGCLSVSAVPGFAISSWVPVAPLPETTVGCVPRPSQEALSQHLAQGITTAETCPQHI